MSIEQKARELVEKFINYAHWEDGSSNNNENSKQCALIAVDENISLLNELAFGYDLNLDREIAYYKEVKQAILNN